MKRPCSQACRLSAKYGSAGASATSATSAVKAISPKPAAARQDTQSNASASANPATKAAAATLVSQASACCGPKFSAVDKVVAAKPSTPAPSTSSARRQPGFEMLNASRHGASRPKTTAMNSPPGVRAAATASVGCSQGAANSATAVPSSASANRSRSRASTWPSPSGTGVGNNKPTGQRKSRLRPPALRAMNQRSRTDCQRSIAPTR